MESLASIYSNLLEQIKKSVYIRKEFNSHTFFFFEIVEHQHGSHYASDQGRYLGQMGMTATGLSQP